MEADLQRERALHVTPAGENPVNRELFSDRYFLKLPTTIVRMANTCWETGGSSHALRG